MRKTLLLLAALSAGAPVQAGATYWCLPSSIINFTATWNERDEAALHYNEHFGCAKRFGSRSPCLKTFYKSLLANGVTHYHAWCVAEEEESQPAKKAPAHVNTDIDSLMMVFSLPEMASERREERE